MSHKQAKRLRRVATAKGVAPKTLRRRWEALDHRTRGAMAERLGMKPLRTHRLTAAERKFFGFAAWLPDRALPEHLIPGPVPVNPMDAETADLGPAYPASDHAPPEDPA